MKLLNAHNAPYYNVEGRIDYISLPHYFLLLFFSNIPTQDFWVLLNAAIFIERLGVWGGSSKTQTFREEIHGLPPIKKFI
jgi:hypothetical protein